MSEAYDPKSALLGMRAGMKALQRKAERAQRPVGLVSSKGKALREEVVQGIDTCCVLLLAFTNRHPMIPDDFHNVERNAKGIQEYVRPDGAIFLGTFELPKDPASAVLVYGDPAMTQEQAAAASLAYRRRLQDAFETSLALQNKALPSKQEN